MTEVSTTVGSITGEMRIDISQWVRAIDQAMSKAKELEGEHATLEISAENRKALDAIDEVEADAKALEATPARVRVEIDAVAAEAKLEEVRATAAKPVVQDVVIRTHDEGGFVAGTLRPTGMGSAPSSGQMAVEQLLGANGDLVKSYRGVEAEVVAVGMAFTQDEENALAVAAAKIQLANASKAAAAAEQAYVKVLNDEKASTDAIAAAEQKALTARHLATQASSEFATVSRELGKAEEDVAAGADDAGKKLTGSGDAAKGARGQFAILGAVILGLGPGLIPLATGAVGTAAALGGLGATGVLAFLGIRSEMTAGTTAGVEYSSMLARLKADAHELENTAAGGILGGANTAAGELQAALPMLNREVGQFSGELGQILPTGVDAVVTGLDRADPLLQAAGRGVVDLVQGLDGFAHSSEFGSFLTTAEQDLPLVGQTIGDTLTFVVRFLSAMGPYGSAVLTIVDDAAKLGSVIAPLAPGIWAMVSALTALKLGAAAGLPMISGLFAGLGTTAAETATEIGAVAVAEDVASEGLTLPEQAAAGAGGAGLLAAAGIGVGVEGLSLASSQGAGKNRPGTPTGAATYDTSYGGFGAPAAKPSSAPSTGIGGGDTSYGGFGAGVSSSATSTAAALITVAQAYSQVAAAAQKAWAAENTNAKSAQSLEGTYDSAADSLAKLGSNMAKNRATLDQSTEAGRKNREAILAVVQAAQQHADAINSDGKHAAQAAVYTDGFAVSLEKSLVKMGMSKTAAEQYIKTLLGIPKNVSLEVALRDAKAQEYLDSIRKRMDNLNGTAATVYVNAVANGVSTGRASQMAKNAGQSALSGFYADGGTAGEHLKVLHAATGSTVFGAGTSGSDSVPAMLSLGEEITSNKNGQADAFRPVLKAINSQQVRTMDDLAAFLGGRSRGSFTQKTVHVGGVHLHSPVAKDPVQSAEDASQLIAAYAGLPL